ncbi:hypothetical protein FPOAC2_03064 [Fusarium poae]
MGPFRMADRASDRTGGVLADPERSQLDVTYTTDRNCAPKYTKRVPDWQQNNEPSLDSAGGSGGGRKLLACITTVDNASFSDGDRIGVMDAVLDGGYSLIH